MATKTDEWRDSFGRKSLSELKFIRDAGHVAGKEKLAVLALVIREKEEAVEEQLLKQQTDMNRRSLDATEKASNAAGKSAVATFLAAIAAAAAVYIGWLQLGTLEKSEAAMRNSSRAFVYFDRLELSPYPRPPDDVAVFGVTVVTTNSGNTPALRMRFRSACLQSAWEFEGDPYELTDWTKVAPGQPMILGPKQTLTLQGCNLTPDQITNLRNGKTNIHVIVETRYEDTFHSGVQRVTQTVQRLRIDAEGGYSFGFVGAHNCSDDNCPQ